MATGERFTIGVDLRESRSDPICAISHAAATPNRPRLWKNAPSPCTCTSTTKSRSSPGPAADSDWRRRRRWRRRGAASSLCARGADALAAAAAALVARGRPAASILTVTADVATPDGAGSRRPRRARHVRPHRHPRQQRRQSRRRRHRDDARCRVAGRASIRRSFRRSACRASSCRTCARRAAASILMIASIWGRESGGRMTYNAVKAAEISLAKAMAQQLASDNIRVNSVAPGSILFEGGSWWKRQQEDPAGIAEFVRRELPFGRFGTRRGSRHRSSRFSPRRARAGSPAPASPSTAVNRGRISSMTDTRTAIQSLADALFRNVRHVAAARSSVPS